MTYSYIKRNLPESMTVPAIIAIGGASIGGVLLLTPAKVMAVALLSIAATGLMILPILAVSHYLANLNTTGWRWPLLTISIPATMVEYLTTQIFSVFLINNIPILNKL